MIYCKNCKKEVVVYGVSYSDGIDNKLEQLLKVNEDEGKLILFNPPPFGPYECSICRTRLEG